jgi:predicted transcriptional regulator
MREWTVKTLDDRDWEFVETLQELGVQQNVAAIIAYLKNVESATSRDIEMGSDLRQPEVSTAAKILRNNGWIEESQIKREGKGRPLKVYMLRAPIDEIIKHFEEEKLQESNQTMQSIQKLKDLATT